VDPRTVVCRLAVERALDWYVAREPEAEVLRGVIAGRRAWDDSLFETLFAFGQTMQRLARDGDAPACNVGDVLTVLAGLAHGSPPWEFDARLDAHAFAKLDFATTSAAIATTQRANREGWWAHARRSRALIEEAARGTPGRKLAVVLGAGQTYDLPLVELAGLFERLVVVDVDEKALASAVSSAFKDPGLRARVEPRVMDLTGINGTVVRRLDELVESARTGDEAVAEVTGLCRSYRLDGAARLLPAGERADLLVSALVVSQLSWPQRVYAERLCAARFAGIDFAAERWVNPWWRFEMRVQHDHIDGLAAAADRVVLTSDVVVQPTAFDAVNVERDSGRPTAALGVESLRERVPCWYEIERHEAWRWSRNLPDRRGGRGSRRELEGVVLRERLLPTVGAGAAAHTPGR
jgi:hypothetical protein